MTTLYRIANGQLSEVKRSSLSNESMLQDWIVKNPKLLGLDVLIVGREVPTGNKGRIDILAIDQEGNLFIIELKRGRTPRDVIAQVLDYASWVAELTTRDVHRIAEEKLGKSLRDAFRGRFDVSLPESLNSNHNMLIVASEFDGQSERIVRYLANEHGVAINTAFFSVFEESGEQMLATDWLMDQQQVVERSDSRKKAPWTGYYYVNSGDKQGTRNWEDMREFGFVSAGHGRVYSQRLEQLGIGDPIYVYQKGSGYVGFGIVQKSAVMAEHYSLPDGRLLSDAKLREPGILHDEGDSEMADYVVGVVWKKTVPISKAKTFRGVFANQNVVCKLTHPDTLDFLAESFGEMDIDGEPAF